MNTSKKFRNVYILGLGGTGNWVLSYLLRSNQAEKIFGWDFDTVEIHNIPRTLFNSWFVGFSKVDNMIFNCEKILKNNKNITTKVELFNCLFDENTMAELLQEHGFDDRDLILDCRDRVFSDTYKFPGNVFKFSYDGFGITLDTNWKNRKLYGNDGGYRVVPSYVVPTTICVAVLMQHLLKYEMDDIKKGMITFNVFDYLKYYNSEIYDTRDRMYEEAVNTRVQNVIQRIKMPVLIACFEDNTSFNNKIKDINPFVNVHYDKYIGFYVRGMYGYIHLVEIDDENNLPVYKSNDLIHKELGEQYGFENLNYEADAYYTFVSPDEITYKISNHTQRVIVFNSLGDSKSFGIFPNLVHSKLLVQDNLDDEICEREEFPEGLSSSTRVYSCDGYRDFCSSYLNDFGTVRSANEHYFPNSVHRLFVHAETGYLYLYDPTGTVFKFPMLQEDFIVRFSNPEINHTYELVCMYIEDVEDQTRCDQCTVNGKMWVVANPVTYTKNHELVHNAENAVLAEIVNVCNDLFIKDYLIF